jgi:eukaryotic-like serine/threonine-protein kinase
MIGQTIGPYHVTAKLGEGGMGEVYRAHDPRLGRDVAIKVLPGSWAVDLDRVARFRREAQVLASLNHTNIAAIYGVEEHAGRQALVLELVEGPTLAELIASGSRTTRAGDRAAPVPDALEIARQIALALEAAHEAGIVHRDLKPANVKVRPDGTVKVLDFGLAKALSPDGASGAAVELANSPTITSPQATALGVLIGTAAYMAPEQARGQAVDRRADVWAFGCVLFELLAGRPAFAAGTVTDTLAAVVRGEPPWADLPADTSLSIRRLLRRCLIKDRKQRLADISVARLEIDDAASPDADGGQLPPAPAVRSRRYERAALALLVLLLMAFTAAVIRQLREPVVPAPPVHFQLEPTGLPLWPAGPPRVSPDGRWVVFVAASDSVEPGRLRVRALDSVDVRDLPGTDGAAGPFWSPDSRSIGFFADGAIRRVELTGGAVQVLGQTSAYDGGSWGAGGTIIYAASTGIWQVPATGGAPALVTPGLIVRGPHFLPDGRRFLFNELTASVTRPVDGHVFMASLDAPEPIRLIDHALGPWYAPPGYLLFGRDGAVMAQPFDAAAGRLRGEAVPVVSVLAMDVSFTLSVSTTGVLVYVPSPPAPHSGTPVWVDRQGRGEPVAGLTLGQVEGLRLSPDGKRVAFVHRGDIWVGDLAGRPPIRLTFDGSTTLRSMPLWTPDGHGVVYEIGTGHDMGLWMLPADGSSNIPTRVSPVAHYHPHGWSPDGRELLALEFPGTTPRRIVALPFGEEGEPRVVVASPAFSLLGASMSPDGRWLAYADGPTGRREIWVRRFAGGGPPVRVSADGGEEPLWARDGRALFFRQGNRMLSVTVDPGDEFQFEAPVALFESNHLREALSPAYDVAADGRFLMLEPADANPAEARAVVVTNWLAELGRRSAAAP